KFRKGEQAYSRQRRQMERIAAYGEAEKLFATSPVVGGWNGPRRCRPPNRSMSRRRKPTAWLEAAQATGQFRNETTGQLMKLPDGPGRLHERGRELPGQGSFWFTQRKESLCISSGHQRRSAGSLFTRIMPRKKNPAR